MPPGAGQQNGAILATVAAALLHLVSGGSAGRPPVCLSKGSYNKKIPKMVFCKDMVGNHKKKSARMWSWTALSCDRFDAVPIRKGDQAFFIFL